MKRLFLATFSVALLGCWFAASTRGAEGPPRRGEFRGPLIAAIDANGDGELSADEIAKASDALKKLDKNQDGKLGPDELRGPMGPGPGGPGQGRQGGPGGPPAARGASLESATVPKDDAEKRSVRSIQEITEKQGRRMNVPVQDGRMLRLLVESIDAKQVVEFGTSNGISAIWMATALRKTGGKLITHELLPEVAKTARENFKLAGVDDLITVVEGDGHKTAAAMKGPIDLVFIDADKEGYLDYLNQTLPLVRPGGLIVAHNMTPRMADPGFVKAITANPDLETLFFNEGGGMSISVKKR